MIRHIALILFVIAGGCKRPATPAVAQTPKASAVAQTASYEILVHEYAATGSKSSNLKLTTSPEFDTKKFAPLTPAEIEAMKPYEGTDAFAYVELVAPGALINRATGEVLGVGCMRYGLYGNTPTFVVSLIDDPIEEFLAGVIDKEEIKGLGRICIGPGNVISSISDRNEIAENHELNSVFIDYARTLGVKIGDDGSPLGFTSGGAGGAVKVMKPGTVVHIAEEVSKVAPQLKKVRTANAERKVFDDLGTVIERRVSDAVDAVDVPKPALEVTTVVPLALRAASAEVTTELRKLGEANSLVALVKKSDRIGNGTFSTAYLMKINDEDVVATVPNARGIERENRAEDSSLFRDRHQMLKQASEKGHFPHRYGLDVKRDIKTKAITSYIGFYELCDEAKKVLPTLDETARFKAIDSILSDLKYLHENGFGHGDIKPENTLFSKKTNQAKLADTNSIPRAGAKAGYDQTTEFTPPAYRNGTVVDHDIFSSAMLMLDYISPDGSKVLQAKLKTFWDTMEPKDRLPLKDQNKEDELIAKFREAVDAIKLEPKSLGPKSTQDLKVLITDMLSIDPNKKRPSIEQVQTRFRQIVGITQ